MCIKKVVDKLTAKLSILLQYIAIENYYYDKSTLSKISLSSLTTSGNRQSSNNSISPPQVAGYLGGGFSCHFVRTAWQHSLISF